jgi:hypothetical protein
MDLIAYDVKPGCLLVSRRVVSTVHIWVKLCRMNYMF